MAVTVEELFDGREDTFDSDNKNPRVRIRYSVAGASGESEVKTEMDSETPSSQYTSLTKSETRITERLNTDTWIVEKTWWKPAVQSGVGEEPIVTFDTAGGTQHITQSKGTVSYGTNPPDNDNAIGFDGEKVHGVDIVSPAFDWSETHILTTVNAAYFGTLFSTTGKVNSDSFRQFSAGEVLFLGCSGSRLKSGEWEMTFRFSASANVTNRTIGTITGISKGGWDYLWVRYETTTDNDAIVQQPSWVYVETIYDETDFSALSLPDWTT